MASGRGRRGWTIPSTTGTDGWAAFAGTAALPSRVSAARLDVPRASDATRTPDDTKLVKRITIVPATSERKGRDETRDRTGNAQAHNWRRRRRRAAMSATGTGAKPGSGATAATPTPSNQV